MSERSCSRSRSEASSRTRPVAQACTNGSRPCTRSTRSSLESVSRTCARSLATDSVTSTSSPADRRPRKVPSRSVTRQRAVATARQILEQGGDLIGAAVSTAGSADLAKQVQGLADDLLATSRTNRDLLLGLIRTEIERTVARLGLVGEDELASMAR